jgi:hypothetical protein
MEQCPKCGRMTAEINHYTKEPICYDRRCNFNKPGYKELTKEEKTYADDWDMD